MKNKGSTTVIGGTIITVVCTVLTAIIGYLAQNTLQMVQTNQAQAATAISTLQEDDSTTKANYANILINEQNIETQLNTLLTKIK